MAQPHVKKPTGKGKPPSARVTAPVVGNNTKKPPTGELKPLNFKVDPEFHRELKMLAAAHDMAMVDVLKEAIALYKQQKGG